MKTYLIIIPLLVASAVAFVSCSAGFRGSIDNPTSSITPAEPPALALR